jgi:hypothetical protein
MDKRVDRPSKFLLPAQNGQTDWSPQREQGDMPPSLVCALELRASIHFYSREKLPRRFGA